MSDGNVSAKNIRRKHLAPNPGDRFNMLVFIKAIHEKGYLKWVCRCDCGKIHAMVPSNIRTGRAKSCGCWKRTKRTPLVIRQVRHCWGSMIHRCHCENDPYYHNYGGRGISVCERWRNSLTDFAADMGPRPSPKHEIDRINNNGNYEPGNCRWATRIEQSRNRRDNQWIEFGGRRMIAADWAKELGLASSASITKRIARWGTERSLTTRIGEDQFSIGRHHGRKIEYNGEIHTMGEWADLKGWNFEALRCRFKRGWSTERSLGKPMRKNRTMNQLPEGNA